MSNLQYLFSNCQVPEVPAVPFPVLYLEGIALPDSQRSDLRISWASSDELTGRVLSEFISRDVLSSLCLTLAQGKVAYVDTGNDDDPPGSWQISPFKEGYIATFHPQNTIDTNEKTTQTSTKELQRRLAFRKIFNDLTSSLINLPFGKFDTYLTYALEQIGRYNGADRCYVFQYSELGDEMSCTHEWCADGILPQQDTLQNLPVSLFPWWRWKMVRHETICLYSLDELPPEAQEEKDILEAQQIHSLLVIPMRMEQRLLGFIGFDAVTRPRYWDEQDVELLETFCQLLVTTIKRFSHEQSIIDFSRRESLMNQIYEALLGGEAATADTHSPVLHQLHALVPATLIAEYTITEDSSRAVAANWLINGDSTSDLDKLAPMEIPLADCPVPEWGPRMSASLHAGQEYESICCIPIQLGGQPLGYLLLADPRRNFITPDTITVLQQVAYLLANFRVRNELVDQLKAQAHQLAQANQLLRVVVESTPVGLALFSPLWQNGQIYDFAYQLTNPANVSLTGRSQDQMRGSTLLTLFPESKQWGLFDKLVQTVLTGQTQHFEEYVNHDRLSLWGYFSLMRVGQDLLFTVQDITPQKKAEELLRHQNEQLEKQVAQRTAEIRHLNALQNAIINYAGLGFAATDKKGIIQLINPALEVMTGYKAHELLGKEAALVLHPLHTRLIPELELNDPTPVREARISNPAPLQQETMLLHKEGHQLPVLSTVSGLYDEQGELLGYVDIVTDISRLKQAQETARTAYHRLELAAATAGLGIWEYDLTTRTISLDEQMHRICGTERQRMPRKAELVSTLIHPADQDRFRQVTADAIAKKGIRGLDLRLVRPDGQLVYAEIRMQLLGDEHQKPLQLIGVAKDHTAQRQTELALQQSKEQYLALVNNLHEIVFQLDLTGSITFLNNAWSQTMGYPLADSIGQSIFSFLSPVDQPGCHQLIAQLVHKETQSCRQTLTFIASNGESKLTEVAAQLLTDAQGLPKGITGTFRDVTEQKQAIDALRHSEQRFKAIFNSTYQMMGLLCPEGTILEMNDTTCLASGIGMDELAGQYLWETHCWQLSPATWQNCRAAVLKAAGGEPVNYETTIWLADYNAVPIDFSVRPLFNEAGEVVLLIVEGHDLSHFKQVQQALLESEQRFGEIAENVDSLFWIREAGLPRFRYINPMYERLTGRSCASLYQDPISFLDFILEEDRPMLLQILTSDQPYDGSILFRARLADRIHWFEARGFYTRDETGKVVRHIGVAQDVTSQIEHKQVLEQALDREQALNKLKSVFLSTASHQFRTPLTAISSSAELISYYASLPAGTLSPPVVHKHAEAILKQVSWLEELMTDTLTLSKIEEDKVILRWEQVDVVALCQTLIGDTFSERSDGRQVELAVVGSPVLIRSDKTLLGHTLQNILSNAFKYAATNPRLTVYYDPDGVRLDVEDEGLGIPADEMPFLFGKFFRARNVSSIPGSGLGLAICQEYVRLLGGTLAVTSTEGVGTTFCIQLPAQGEPLSSGG